MGDELKFRGQNASADSDAPGEAVTGLIRDAYAPPGGDEYWSGLTQRIMARVAADSGDTPWWNLLAPWARPALIAAAAIFVLASVINRQLVESDSQLAYDSVIQASTPDVLATSQEMISVESGTDGATISYFLSH